MSTEPARLSRIPWESLVDSSPNEINGGPGKPPSQETSKVIPGRLDLSVKRSMFFFNQSIDDQLLFSSEQTPRLQWATRHKMQYA
jgi:hypothetical protein